MTIEITEAQWDAPPEVHAFTTLRSGGISKPPYDSLNLALHVGDDVVAVTENRDRLRRQFLLPAQPVWLSQAHSTNIVYADRYIAGQAADGAFTSTTGVVCAVLTADCLPLFICSSDGTRVGLFHVGWKGLVRGIVKQAVGLFSTAGGAMAWLGPCIGPSAFEIGAEVKTAIEQSLQTHPRCFVPAQDGKYLADLYELVAGELKRYNISCGYDATSCTYTDTDRFFSYRRSKYCGRLASVIWIEK
ncbi:MAG: peptidoglycan editing factor PgeF [Arenicellales bacterium]|nr:peptidoglycan editing factor PgeF [Arenicellales bacterium]